MACCNDTTPDVPGFNVTVVRASSMRV
jgi:hypothetical protein